MKVPKDRKILIESPYTGKTVAIWSEAEKKFAYAELQADMYNGSWNMMYFETDYINEADIKEWSELL